MYIRSIISNIQRALIKKKKEKGKGYPGEKLASDKNKQFTEEIEMVSDIIKDSKSH